MFNNTFCPPMLCVFYSTTINYTKYDVNMQQQKDKTLQFMKAAGCVFRKIRYENTDSSINKFAREYDIDRGNLSRIERGLIGCSLMTAWRIAEAGGIKFSEFAKQLENELGNDFKLIDE